MKRAIFCISKSKLNLQALCCTYAGGKEGGAKGTWGLLKSWGNRDGEGGKLGWGANEELFFVYSIDLFPELAALWSSAAQMQHVWRGCRKGGWGGERCRGLTLSTTAIWVCIAQQRMGRGVWGKWISVAPKVCCCKAVPAGVDVCSC